MVWIIFFCICSFCWNASKYSLYMWGKNEDYKLGTTISKIISPKFIEDNNIIESLTIKDFCQTERNSVLLSDSNKIYIWGSNGHSLIPVKTKTPTLAYNTTKTIASISCGYDNVFFRTSDISDNLYGFGKNQNGVLGDGTTNACSSPKVLDVSGYVNHFSVGKFVGVVSIIHLDSEYVFTSGKQTKNTLGWDSGADHTSYLRVAIPHDDKSRIRAIYDSSSVIFIHYEDHVIYGWGDSKIFLLVGETDVEQRTPVEITWFEDHDYEVFDIKCEVSCVAIVKSRNPSSPNQNFMKIVSWGYSGSGKEFFLGRFNSSESDNLPFEVNYGDYTPSDNENIVKMSITDDGYLFLMNNGKVYGFGKNTNYMFGKADEQYSSSFLTEIAEISLNQSISVFPKTMFHEFHSVIKGYSCNGLMCNSPSVCQNHGTCVSQDNCLCSVPYISKKFCSVTHSCHGIFNSSAEVCNFRSGSCVSQDRCICNSGYYGINCNVTKCGDKFSNSSDVCGSKGKCKKFDSCSCSDDSNYFGKSCEEVISRKASIDLKKLIVEIGFSCLWNIISSAGLNNSFSCSLLVKSPERLGSCSQPNQCCNFIVSERRETEKRSSSLVISLGKDHSVSKDSVISVSSVSDRDETISIIIEEKKNSDTTDDENNNNNNNNALANLDYLWILVLLFPMGICLFSSIVLFFCCLNLIMFCYVFTVCGIIALLGIITTFTTTTTAAVSTSKSSPNNGDRELDVMAYYSDVNSPPSDVELPISVIPPSSPVTPKKLKTSKKKVKNTKKKTVEVISPMIEESFPPTNSIASPSSIGEALDVEIDPRLFDVDYREIQVFRKVGDGEIHPSIQYSVHRYDVEWNSKPYQLWNIKFPRIFYDSDVYKEFEHILITMKELSHPNIFSYFGSSLRHSQPPLAAEIGILSNRVEYGNLRNYFESHRIVYDESLGFFEKLEILHSVADAMCYLHTQDIILYELKPRNVYVGKCLNAKINPFVFYRSEFLSNCVDGEIEENISKKKNFKSNREKRSSSVGSDGGKRKSKRLVVPPKFGVSEAIGSDDLSGNLFYHISPERLRGDFDKISEKADVFAYGMLIYTVMSSEFQQPYGYYPDWRSLRKRISANPNFRPKIRPGDYYQKKWLLDLTVLCWSDDVLLRPSFTTILGKYFEKNNWKKIKIREKGWFRKSRDYQKDILNSYVSSNANPLDKLNPSHGMSHSLSSPALKSMQNSPEMEDMLLLARLSPNSSSSTSPLTSAKDLNSEDVTFPSGITPKTKRFSLSKSMRAENTKKPRARSKTINNNIGVKISSNTPFAFGISESINRRAKTPNSSPRNSTDVSNMDMESLKKLKHRSAILTPSTTSHFPSITGSRRKNRSKRDSVWNLSNMSKKGNEYERRVEANQTVIKLLKMKLEKKETEWERLMILRNRENENSSLRIRELVQQTHRLENELTKIRGDKKMEDSENEGEDSSEDESKDARILFTKIRQKSFENKEKVHEKNIMAEDDTDEDILE